LVPSVKSRTSFHECCDSGKWEWLFNLCPLPIAKAQVCENFSYV
jgi:hypothetical protein